MTPLTIRRSCGYIFFHPSNDYFLFLGRDIEFWDLKARKVLWKSKHLKHVPNAEFSPDGKSVLIKNTSGQLSLLDTFSGEPVIDYQTQGLDDGSNPAFSPCGKYILNGLGSSHYRLWDSEAPLNLTVYNAATGDVTYEKNFENQSIRTIRVSSVLNRVIILAKPKANRHGVLDKTAYALFWDWPLDENSPTEIVFKGDPRMRCDVSVKGTLAAVTRIYDNQWSGFDVYSLPENEIVWSDHANDIDFFHFSTCGEYLMAAVEDGFRVYQSVGGKVVTEYDGDYPHDIALSNDSRLVGCSFDKKLVIQEFEA